MDNWYPTKGHQTNKRKAKKKRETINTVESVYKLSTKLRLGRDEMKEILDRLDPPEPWGLWHKSWIVHIVKN